MSCQRCITLEKALREIETDTKWAEDMHRDDPKALRYALVMTRDRARLALQGEESTGAREPAPALSNDRLAKLERLVDGAWTGPWVAHTFEIDCPCPNGAHCGDDHSCEEVEAPEAYPASPEQPAEPGEGQCVVQISVPGLESLAHPTAQFIAAARTAVPELIAEIRRLRAPASPASAAPAEPREPQMVKVRMVPTPPGKAPQYVSKTYVVGSAAPTPAQAREPRDFQRELTSLLNRFCRENESDTPDFILAEFMLRSLDAFDVATARRSAWYAPPEPAAPPAEEKP